MPRPFRTQQMIGPASAASSRDGVLPQLRAIVDDLNGEIAACERDSDNLEDELYVENRARLETLRSVVNRLRPLSVIGRRRP